MFTSDTIIYIHHIHSKLSGKSIIIHLWLYTTIHSPTQIYPCTKEVDTRHIMLSLGIHFVCRTCMHAWYANSKVTMTTLQVVSIIIYNRVAIILKIFICSSCTGKKPVKFLLANVHCYQVRIQITCNGHQP